MVYQLPRPVEHEAIRQGATLMPHQETESIRLVSAPHVVWGPDLCELLPLRNERRSVVWQVHNAGGAPCRLESASADVPWLHVTCGAQTLPDNGRSVLVTLHIQPGSQLPPGEHTARVTLTFAGADAPLLLERRFTLQVPDQAIPWFDDPAPIFRGSWRKQQVTLRSVHPVHLYYADQRVAEVQAGGIAELYPAEYRLGGARGDVVLPVLPDQLLPPVSVPGTFRVPGPVLRVRLTNLGSKYLTGRLVPAAPWLVVEPSLLTVAPGAEEVIRLEVHDDGRYWNDGVAAVELRAPYSDQRLAQITVTRDFQLPGPRPALAQPLVEIAPVAPGDTASASVSVWNAGDAPLELKRESGERFIVHTDNKANIVLTVGPPHTAKPGRIRGKMLAVTNAPLPYWRWFTIPYTLDVVYSNILSRNLAFGMVRYREQHSLPLRVERSDNRRGKLAIRFPSELQGTFAVVGERVYMKNMQPRPFMVDAEFEVIDHALGDAVLGTVRITGHCLVPKLEVRIPEVRIVPGQSAMVPIQVIDAGGGLELEKIRSSRPEWAIVKRRAQQVHIDVHTTYWERGTKSVTLTFLSNDFVAPEQDHLLTVVLMPTRGMRVLDSLMWLIGPAWKVLKPLWVRVEPYWQKVKPSLTAAIANLTRPIRTRR